MMDEAGWSTVSETRTCRLDRIIAISEMYVNALVTDAKHLMHVFYQYAPSLRSVPIYLDDGERNMRLAMVLDKLTDSDLESFESMLVAAQLCSKLELEGIDSKRTGSENGAYL